MSSGDQAPVLMLAEQTVTDQAISAAPTNSVLTKPSLQTLQRGRVFSFRDTDFHKTPGSHPQCLFGISELQRLDFLNANSDWMLIPLCLGSNGNVENRSCVLAVTVNFLGAG